MATSNQPKGKRSLRITLGWFAGGHAFQADGTATAGATTFLVPSRQGDFTASDPRPTIADPLDQGEKNLDAAPVLVDDQDSAGGFGINYKFETDAAILGMMDVLYEDGTASALPSVITGSEEIYCDMKVETIHPGLAADAHGRVYGQVRFTHAETMGDTQTEAVSWTSREGVYARF
jgi:hypothetical protein